MSWSPDGDLLAVTAGATPSLALAYRGVTSGWVTSDRPTRQRRTAATSPRVLAGRTRIAFIRSIADRLSDIFVTSVDGGAPTPVTSDNADVLGVDWEPDGRHLVFSSDRAAASTCGGSPEGGTSRAGGGRRREAEASDVARRTGTVAYEDWHYEINLRERGHGRDDPAATARQPDERSVELSIRRFRPTATAGVSVDPVGRLQLWIAIATATTASRDGFRSLQVAARWSADGRRIVFAYGRRRKPKLWS